MRGEIRSVWRAEEEKRPQNRGKEIKVKSEIIIIYFCYFWDKLVALSMHDVFQILRYMFSIICNAFVSRTESAALFPPFTKLTLVTPMWVAYVFLSLTIV
jgi:hypothetical protein